VVRFKGITDSSSKFYSPVEGAIRRLLPVHASIHVRWGLIMITLTEAIILQFDYKKRSEVIQIFTERLKPASRPRIKSLVTGSYNQQFWLNASSRRSIRTWHWLTRSKLIPNAGPSAPTCNVSRKPHRSFHGR
jgi:hypothetical protein